MAPGEPVLSFKQSDFSFPDSAGRIYTMALEMKFLEKEGLSFIASYKMQSVLEPKPYTELCLTSMTRLVMHRSIRYARSQAHTR
jgi:hypothetical protein